MEDLIVVTHPEPILLEARPLAVEAAEAGNVALAYYHDGHLLARGFVASEAMSAIEGILSNPVSIALAATADQNGNIDARFCLVLPVDSEFRVDEDEAGEGESHEAWRSSLPDTPLFESAFEQSYDADADDGEERPRVALLPIGNIIREASERHHPDDVARDLHDMLQNLMEGRAQDAISKAIDDLLNSI